VFTHRIVRNVQKLVSQVIRVPHAVLMVSAVPDFALRLLANCEGVSTLDELNAARSTLVYRWSDQDMNMVQHDDKAMHLKLSGIAVAKESCDKKLSVHRALKMTMALEGENCDGISALLLPDGRHTESIPQRLKPGSLLL
jgi:hypothetical protein